MRKFFSLAMAAALTAAGAGPAWAGSASGSDAEATMETAAAALTPNTFVWNDPGTAEPVTVVVSLPLQRAYVYRGLALVAATAVSTGRDGKDTPVGIYPVLQKAEVYHSNLYNSASMPFMQRLTWDGIALHAGKNPGFPDSHGCVRLPAAFAQKLFGVTQLGTTVVVTDQAVEPGPLDPEMARTDAQRANAAQLAALAPAPAAGPTPAALAPSPAPAADTALAAK